MTNIHDLCRLKSESENLRSELDSRQGASMTQEQDIEKMRDELRGVQREGAEKVRELDGAVAAAQQAAQMHAQQFELLKGDVLKFQAAARAAHGSYERELQLHAKAERDLSDAETGDIRCLTHSHAPYSSHRNIIRRKLNI